MLEFRFHSGGDIIEGFGLLRRHALMKGSEKRKSRFYTWLAFTRFLCWMGIFVNIFLDKSYGEQMNTLVHYSL